jgi:hypothetical protein
MQRKINIMLILIPVSATGNPVQCDAQLVETTTVMEANYTKLYGLGHCLSVSHIASTELFQPRQEKQNNSYSN